MVELAFAISGQTQSSPAPQSRQQLLPHITAVEAWKASLTWPRLLDLRRVHSYVNHLTSRYSEHCIVSLCQ